MSAIMDTITGMFSEVKTRFENFNVLEKTVEDAQAAKEKARNELAKFLEDVDAALHKIKEEVGPVVPDPAPVDPSVPKEGG